eukprot:3424618-Rhodomonas_salina.1
MASEHLLAKVLITVCAVGLVLAGNVCMEGCFEGFGLLLVGFRVHELLILMSVWRVVCKHGCMRDNLMERARRDAASESCT